jgi:hypothetical protein
MKSANLNLNFLCLLAIAGIGGCEKPKPVPPPIVRPNSEAPKKVELTIDVGALPAQRVSGFAQFDIANNQKCVEPDSTRALGGVHNSFKHAVEMSFRKTGVSKFTATLVTNPFQDEDYYGRGVCHWHFTGATIALSQGIPEQTIIFWRSDLPTGSETHILTAHCAAEPKYALPPPMNSCKAAEFRAKKEGRHNNLLTVNIYSRGI